MTKVNEFYDKSFPYIFTFYLMIPGMFFFHVLQKNEEIINFIILEIWRFSTEPKTAVVIFFLSIFINLISGEFNTKGYIKYKKITWMCFFMSIPLISNISSGWWFLSLILISFLGNVFLFTRNT